MPGNVFWGLLKGVTKYIESILGLWWLLLFICVNILFRQKYRITQEKDPFRWVCLRTWASGILQMPVAKLRQKKNTSTYYLVTYLSAKIARELRGHNAFTFEIFLLVTLRLSLTLASQFKHSLYTILAIKDVHGVLPFVLLSGLIDLKPKLLSSDSRLNSFGGRNLSVSDKEMRIIKVHSKSAMKIKIQIGKQVLHSILKICTIIPLLQQNARPDTYRLCRWWDFFPICGLFSSNSLEDYAESLSMTIICKSPIKIVFRKNVKVGKFMQLLFLILHTAWQTDLKPAEVHKSPTNNINTTCWFYCGTFKLGSFGDICRCHASF